MLVPLINIPCKRSFDDMLHKFVECYVDGLVVKTKKMEDHLEDLRTVFNWLRKYDLKMNPLKRTFRVTSGKFLGLIVRHRGIEVNQSTLGPDWGHVVFGGT